MVPAPCPYLAEVVLQLQLAALGLAEYQVPALAQLLQSLPQPLLAIAQAAQQQPLPGLAHRLHRARVAQHIVPQHLGTGTGTSGTGHAA